LIGKDDHEVGASPVTICVAQPHSKICVATQTCADEEDGATVAGLSRVGLSAPDSIAEGAMLIVIDAVLEHASGRTLLLCAATCRGWRTACGDARWAAACARDFGIPRDGVSGRLLLFSAQQGPESLPRLLRPPPQPHIPSNHAFAEGEEVSARYRSGAWYPARVVARVVEDSCEGSGRDAVRVAWLDGDPSDTIKAPHELRRTEVTLPARPLPPAWMREPFQGHRRLWTRLAMSGWEAAGGLEAQDYVGKWYLARVVGFDVAGSGGVSATSLSGHAPRQSGPVPPGGCRVKVHYEGWTEKWDEFLLLPAEAHRLRPLWGAPALAVGGRRDPGAVIGNVSGLRVRRAAARGPPGAFEPAQVMGAAAPPPPPAGGETSADGRALGACGAGELHLLVRFRDGAHRWLRLPAERELVEPGAWAYPEQCGCQECRNEAQQQPAAPPDGLNTSL